jgi:cell division protein FtsL
MAARHRRKKKRYISYHEKILYIVSIIITLLLSLAISIFTDSRNKFSKLNRQSEVPYTGSAVRKETTTRENYEKYYRKKEDQWKEEYQNILNNREEIKELEKLEIEEKK